MESAAPGPVPRRSLLILGALVAAGLGLRLWYWLSIRHSLLFTVPYLDGYDYDVWARALAGGDWGRGQPYWMGPLYPHLLALSYAVFGAGSPALVLGQWLLTLLNVVLVYRLGRRWLGETGALVGAALYAGYGPTVFYAGFRLMETVVTTLTLLVAQQAWRATGRPTGRAWLGLGLLVGATATARGNALMLLPLLPCLLPWRAGAWRRSWRLAGALGLGAALAILPVTLRNLLVGGDLVLLTSNAGVNLLIGQQAQYGGRFGPVTRVPQFEFDPTGETLVETDLGHDLAPSAVSRELSRRALARLASEPRQMVAHYARKAYRFWSGYELPQIYSWNFWHERWPALRFFPVPFVLISALALTGFVAARPAARRQLLVLVGAWFLGLMPFFPTARYRLAVVPLLALAAAAAILAIAAAVRARSWRRADALIGLGLALLVALWPTWSALDPLDETWHCHLNNASLAADAGERAAMLAACAEAEAVRPGLAETPYRQGGYLEKLGDLAGALAAYEEAQRRLPDNPFVLYRRARTLAALGRHDEALAGYAAAAAADSTWSFPWHGQALSLKELGRLAEAESALARAIALEPGRSRFRSNLASLLAEQGRLDEAAAILRELTADFPGYLPGWFNLALVQARQGQNEAARRTLERAAALPRLSAEERAQVDRLRQQLATAR
ncbi:MAG TPA: tetratricopeptide repeat protein [Candidatus Krumholzibacteria bacterium]|nr:tetratricopeptide repeat protein [Candidatus Krumholzibacteria bacterium]HPD72996.1 tetratricopeptide repeat protein [Candidatus Krumholzibacteria bacterium]HRY41795.1 tetratricopeptide repeat protein [Candidatus Krumholzibacteria bacterium]